MHLTKIKKASEIDLGEAKIEFRTKDGGSIIELILTHKDQRYVVSKPESYTASLDISREDQHRTEERHVVEGKVHEIPFRETFKDERSAKDRFIELERHGATAVIHKAPVQVDHATDEEVPF